MAAATGRPNLETSTVRRHSLHRKVSSHQSKMPISLSSVTLHLPCLSATRNLVSPVPELEYAADRAPRHSVERQVSSHQSKMPISLSSVTLHLPCLSATRNLVSPVPELTLECDLTLTSASSSGSMEMSSNRN